MNASWKCVLTLTFAAVGAWTSKAADLRISEICPRPRDANGYVVKDPNGYASGWIELYNPGPDAVNLKDYALERFNRGKAAKAGSFANLPDMTLAAKAYQVVYTCEDYPATVNDGKTPFVSGGVVVVPFKINPKKFPMVRLMKGTTELERFLVPVDLKDGYSFAPAGGDFATCPAQPAGSGAATSIKAPAAVTRVILPTPTKGAINNYAGAIAYGPNAGPLYGVKHSLSDLDAVPQAKAGADYAVSLMLNPLSSAENDQIASATLYYRADFGAVSSVALTYSKTDATAGATYTATIPKAGVPAAGHLLRWCAVVTDKAGNSWRTPSFRNPDDGYEWYGTLVEPTADQVSATLQTWHIFTDELTETDMEFNDGNDDLYFGYEWTDRDGTTKTGWAGYLAVYHPYGMRVALYDSQTSNYYDNVKIAVRGNSTAQNYNKKSHTLRFNKCKPLVCVNPFDGEEIECRKTSVIAEAPDYSRLRVCLSVKMRRAAGQDVPFCYPVRVQRNGAFYQLDFHTNRFTDELFEDYYGYDPSGYAVKNIGALGGEMTGGWSYKPGYNPGNKIYGNQILPDLDDGPLNILAEDGAATLFQYSLADTVNNHPSKTGMTAEQQTTVNQVVVKSFDLPAWLNFLALSRLTQESDDVWANLCLYCDVNGNGTWRPMAYDVDSCLGSPFVKANQRPANNDDIGGMSHPFYGGVRVGGSDTDSRYGNRGYEAVYQNPKFRRLMLRRLRTLMDTQLKAPGTTQANTPFWSDYVPALKAAMKADSVLDFKKWNGKDMGMDANIDSLWNDFIAQRRTHLFQTHSVDNTSFSGDGYGRAYNACIPHAQSPLANLQAGITAAYDATHGAVVIRNANAEAIDLSGWTLAGPVAMTLPAGTVIDQKVGSANGELYVTADRRTTVTKFGNAITDQVIVGNGSAGAASATITLTAADGTKVIASTSDVASFLRLDSFDGITPTADGDTDEWITLKNTGNSQLDLSGVKIVFVKDGELIENAKCVVTIAAGTKLAAGATITLKQADYKWNKITNGKLWFYLTDAGGAEVQTLYINQKDAEFANYYGAGGPGGAYYLRAQSYDADGVTFKEVASAVTESNVAKFLRLHSFDGVTPTETADTEEWITVTNISGNVSLELKGVKLVFLKAKDRLEDAKCVVTNAASLVLAPGKSHKFEQAACGWEKISNGDVVFSVIDADGATGQSLAISQPSYADYYGEYDTTGSGGEFYLLATTFQKSSETFAEVAYPGAGGDEPPAVTPQAGNLKLYPLFSDNMILQRDRKLKIWGTADPAASVTVWFGGAKATGKADSTGAWSVTFAKTFSASTTGRALTVSDGTHVIACSNVLVGDVWLALGQSNMELTLKDTTMDRDYSSEATDLIRFRRIEKVQNAAATAFPPNASGGVGHDWCASSVNFLTHSAVAFHFARFLREAQTGVPQGIIDSSYANTPLAYHLTSGGSVWGGMTRWAVGYEVRGAIWYQGCNDAKAGNARYDEQLKAMVADYRAKWGRSASEFAFYIVQIASVNDDAAATQKPGDKSNTAWVRDCQRRVSEALSGSGLAVSFDVSDATIHPRHKVEIGNRLARLARKGVYGENLVTEGPMFASATRESGKIRVHFRTDTLADGLEIGASKWVDENYFVPTPTAPLKGFDIADANGKWVAASAEIAADGKSVLVWSSEIADPRQVSYANCEVPVANYQNQYLNATLYNSEGLPASPFAAQTADEGQDDPGQDDPGTGGGDEPDDPPSGDVTATTTTATDGSGDTVVTFTIPAGSTDSGTTTWTVPAGVTSVRYLVVGGGGSGGHSGSWGAGGGGGGGVLTQTVGVHPGQAFAITVGAGGAKLTARGRGNTGSDSSLVCAAASVNAVAKGGGGGGGRNANESALPGGCGGGGSEMDAAKFSNPGAGTSGQGCDGGRGYNLAGGGGGGAGGTGGDADESCNGGNGGDGLESDITGVSRYYAAGGAGGKGKAGMADGQPGQGGVGAGSDGTDGLGAGGGGLTQGGTGSGAGGSGAVILRYAAGGDEPGPVTHTHDYAWTVTEPTCLAAGVSNGVCQATSGTCDAPTVSIAFGEKVDHVYENGKCKWCHQDDPGTGGGDEPVDPPSGDVTAGPIPDHEDWGYVTTYAKGGKNYAAYVYTNVFEEMTFTVPSGVNALDYLVVAGGGGGGNQNLAVLGGGGGGGGGVLANTVLVTPNQSFAIAVGAGGQIDLAPGRGKNGGDSSLVSAAASFSEVAKGGGGGGGRNANNTASAGGSGGGGHTLDAKLDYTSGGTGSSGQGCDGGRGYYRAAGGGGGAGSTGGDADTSANGGDGGAGFPSDITGTTRYYGAGGAGGMGSGDVTGTRDGAAATDGAGVGENGADGLGAGGGGFTINGKKAAGKGGSGVVVICHEVSGGEDPDPVTHTHDYAWTVTEPTCLAAGVSNGVCKATSGTCDAPTVRIEFGEKVDHVYVDGKCQWCHQDEPVDPPEPPPSGDVTEGPIPGHEDWGYVCAYKQGNKEYRAFVYTNVTAEMSFPVPADVTSIDYLVIGGGGGGGGAFGGGGGAGGFLEDTLSSGLASTYAIQVGAGGTGGVDNVSVGANGGNSSLGTIVALGGGGGATYNVNVQASAGGSGGGGSAGKGTSAPAAGAGTEGQGFAGGDGVAASAAGGGGGAGGPGVAGVTTPAKKSGDGGVGLTSDITGETREYAGGGGGCGDTAANKLTAGAGKFGGGDGGVEYGSGADATSPGSGGGGAARIYSYSTSHGHGGRGADGIVVVRYEVTGGGDDPQPESDGYMFTFKGAYAGDQAIAPTGAECVVVLDDATVAGKLVLPGGVKAYLSATNGTANALGGVIGPGAHLTVKDFDGLGGKVAIEGKDTLIAISNLVVKSGTLELVSTGSDTTNKVRVVNVLGHVKQDGGTIRLDAGRVDPSVQVQGVYVANKDPKGADGKKLKVVYAEFNGGTFEATVGGGKSSALFINKGSAEATFNDGHTNVVSLAGPEARFVNAAGDLNLKGGEFSVTMPDEYASLTNARVFKSDKAIKVKGGHYAVNVPAAGSEIFSVSYNGEDESAITIDAGTFELVAADDCFSADYHITVNGGLFHAVSLNDDVFDSNGDITLNGGTILAYATAGGHEAFDVDPVLTTNDTGVAHKLYVNGGVVFATGGKGAAWPENTVLGAGVGTYAKAGLESDDHSGKYLTLAGAADMRYAAKLPQFPQAKCAVFATCPGLTGTPTLSSSAPAEGDQHFHDYYLWANSETNQGELRFHTIYGSTTDGGDTGEYIVLTNVSAKTVKLAGVTVSSAKFKGGVLDNPKCKITLAGGEVGPNGSVRLDQADYAGKGWEKITNGGIFIKIESADGAVVQSGYASFDLYPETDGGGAALVAKRFDDNTKPLEATMADWGWTMASVPGPTADGDPIDFDEATFRDTTKVNSSKTVLFPSEPKVEGRTIAFGGKSVTMRDYYDVSVRESSGQWQLVLALNESAEPAFADDAQSGEKAITVKDGTVKLHLGETQEGLWYALGSADSPDAADADWTLGDWQQSGDFEAETEGAPQRFYKVFVRDH